MHYILIVPRMLFGHNTDMIITKSVTGFARNTVDSIQAIRKLKSLGIAMYFEKERSNTLPEKSEQMPTILSSLPQREYEGSYLSILFQKTMNPLPPENSLKRSRKFTNTVESRWTSMIRENTKTAIHSAVKLSADILISLLESLKSLRIDEQQEE